MAAYRKIPIDSITVEGRIRQEFDRYEIKTLAESIKRFGLINPILVTRHNAGYKLVAGERRLRAFRLLNMDEIPAMLEAELDEIQLRELELEENVRRSDLTWQEEVAAIKAYHALRCKADPDWTMAKTGAALLLNSDTIGEKLGVANALDEGHHLVSKVSNYWSAATALRREADRRRASEFDQFTSVQRASEQEADADEEPEDDIICGDFIEFAKNYSGRPFNFLHCDFPYGIGQHRSGQGSQGWEVYEDDPEIYWRLLEVLLEHRDKLIAPSAHIMFWFTMKFYERTCKLFRASGFKVDPYPLIWNRTDGKGIVPDAQRGGRRTYETALHIARGDRKIVKVVNISYPSPTTKDLHQSQKPEPMLRHFFEMYVDATTELLDPTCGSGTSLCAADRLNAKRVKGLELSNEYAASARNSLTKSRIIRAAGSS